jgi:hypothetical protein
MIAAVTEPDNPAIQTALAAMQPLDLAPMTGDGVKPRGHNPPATADDDDLLESYESVVTVDDLPEEFR